MPQESLKILGPLSITIAVAAAWVIIKTWPQHEKVSISKHAGAHQKAYWLFASVLILDGLLFFIFMWRWFAPAMGLSAGFVYLLLAGYLLQIATALIPERGDHSRTSRAHRYAAFGMAFIMMLLAGRITLAPYVAAFPRALAGLAFTWMGIAWCLFLFVKSTHRHFLVYQASYIVSFYICVLAATYLT